MPSGFTSDTVNDTVAPPGSEAIDPDLLKAELDIILGFVLGSLGLLVVARLLFLQISGSNSRGLVRSLAGFLDDVFVPASAMLLVPAVVFVFICCALESFDGSS